MKRGGGSCGSRQQRSRSFPATWSGNSNAGDAQSHKRHYTKERHNVIRGEFARPRQKQWAVLCTIKGVSSVLVFWNGSEKSPANLARLEDCNYLEGIDENRIGFVP